MAIEAGCPAPLMVAAGTETACVEGIPAGAAAAGEVFGRSDRPAHPAAG